MTKKQMQTTLQQLGNPDVPAAHRYQYLSDLASGAREEKEGYAEIVDEICHRIQASEAENKYLKLEGQLKEMIQQIELTPLRPGTFVQMAEVDGSSARHALVSLDNGDMAYVVAHDQLLFSKLKLGDRVLVDAKMKILVHPILNSLYQGGEARLERKIDDCHLEVLTHQDEKSVVLASKDITDAIAKGTTKPGDFIVLGAGGRIAIQAIPQPDDTVTHYRFLDKGRVPDVRVERDIGNPPAIIAQVARHVREEMTRPELRRKYRLRPCITRLLCGVSGTGKTLAIQAMHRLIYKIMAEVTGIPLEELPPRVFRLKSSKMLSMWFGESDKNIDRLFDEVEHLADQPFKAKNQEHKLPVMVVLEEADGLGRARGGDTIYDRIMTVILQRLDPNREGLSDKLVVFLSTTNEPHIVDPAFLRRIGGSVETFGRLDRKGFVDILSKHIAGLPSKSKRLAEEVASEIFDNGDRGVVQLDYQGRSEPVVKFKRDFLTGAMIDRAVQQAASAAWEEAIADLPEAAITPRMVAQALESQVASVAHQLVPENVGRYLDIPDGVRVTRVRRIPQSA